MDALLYHILTKRIESVMYKKLITNYINIQNNVNIIYLFHGYHRFPCSFFYLLKFEPSEWDLLPHVWFFFSYL